jgi:tryptophan halogenase
MGDAELAHFLDSIKNHVHKVAMQLPSHQSYVEQYCRAPM